MANCVLSVLNKENDDDDDDDAGNGSRINCLATFTAASPATVYIAAANCWQQKAKSPLAVVIERPIGCSFVIMCKVPPAACYCSV